METGSYYVAQAGLEFTVILSSGITGAHHYVRLNLISTFLIIPSRKQPNLPNPVVSCGGGVTTWHTQLKGPRTHVHILGLHSYKAYMKKEQESGT